MGEVQKIRETAKLLDRIATQMDEQDFSFDYVVAVDRAAEWLEDYARLMDALGQIGMLMIEGRRDD